MNKRKLATLVAASFAGLMLSSPSFATDANKAQTTASASRAAESRSIERVDKKATAPQAPEDRAAERAQDRAVSSANAKTEADAEYKAAVEKCESQPIGQRSACVQDAEKAQTLAMQQSRGASSSGEPQESHRTGTSKPSKPDASDIRATERAEDKVVASATAKSDPEAEYKAAVEKCDSQPIDQRRACVQDAEKAQTLTMQQRQDGASSSEAPKSGSIERADDKAAKQTGTSESRVPGQQSAK